MIENLLLFIFCLAPFAVAFVFASLIVYAAEKIIAKKQRAKRKAEHQAQADADMTAMYKEYNRLLLNEIMKGNEL